MGWLGEDAVPLEARVFKVGQRVVVQQPAMVSPVAMAPALSVTGTITGTYMGDYIVKLDVPSNQLEIAVVPESRLRPA